MELGSGSCSNSSSSNSSDSLNGLKFGGKIYFESANGPGGSSTASKPPPSPAKKGKVRMGTGGQPPLCQVEGCNQDLSDAKAYYSRHKVCMTHSMSPKVIVSGIEQRFCQQCSRFHMVSQFDQGKRSCRKRLANHNERRRKPSPGSLFSALHGTLSSPFLESSGRGGSFVLDFSKCPDLSGRDSWPKASSTMGKNSPNMMWHCSSKASSSYSDPPSGESFTGGVSDCSSALSLLSTKPSGSGDRSSSSLGMMNGFVDAHGVQSSSGSNRDDMNGFSSTLWGGYKGNESNSSSLEMLLPDLGSGRILQPDTSRYYEDLEAAQHNEGDHHLVVENPRGYDSSSEQNMHWFS